MKIVTLFLLDTQFCVNFGQIRDKEIRRGVARRFVISHAILPFVARQHVNRFKRRRAHIFQMHIFHVAIRTDFYTHRYPVADFYWRVRCDFP